MRMVRSTRVGGGGGKAPIGGVCVCLPRPPFFVELVHEHAHLRREGKSNKTKQGGSNPSTKCAGQRVLQRESGSGYGGGGLLVIPGIWFQGKDREGWTREAVVVVEMGTSGRNLKGQ